jgi:hypothetical protein
MKFKFLGTPECPEEIMLRDVVFPKGKPVDVQDEDFIRKLTNSPYFAVEADEAPAEKPKRGRPRKVEADE